jgi:putative membrane protein
MPASTSGILPTTNALLNCLSAAFLTLGYVKIRKGQRDQHRLCMLGACFTSALFLVCYLWYHYDIGSVPYPRHDWTRPVYFAILIPHIILAAAMVPFVARTLWLALWRQDFHAHARVARWVWPVWMYVSLSGVAIYLLLYRI